MGTQRVQMKGDHPWLFRWACRAGTRDFCLALAALAANYKIFFFLPFTFSILVVPVTQQAGQAAVLGRLSLSTDLS
jgi:hypothetical protein